MDRAVLSNPSPPPDADLVNPETKIKVENENPGGGLTGVKKEPFDVDDDQFFENEYMHGESWDVLDNEYYCKVCKSYMNSEQTYLFHLNGKRHKKKLAAANYTAPDLVKVESGSNTNMQQIKLYGAPLLVKTRQSFAKPRIQGTLDKISVPVIGLGYVTEIQVCDENQDPIYRCHLCPADCQVTTIVNHITGFKHRTAYMKIVDPETYKVFFKSQEKKSSLSERVERHAARLEKYDGRGKMLVEIQVEADESFATDGTYQTEGAVPQHPQSTLPQFLEQSRNLTNAEFHKLMENMITDMSTKYVPNTEQKLQVLKETLETYYTDTMIKKVDQDRVKSDKVDEYLKEGKYSAVLQDVFHMSLGSMYDITKSVVLQLAKEGRT